METQTEWEHMCNCPCMSYIVKLFSLKANLTCGNKCKMNKWEILGEAFCRGCPTS